MTALDQLSHIAGAVRPLGWMARVALAAAGIVQGLRNRAAMRQLSELTDYELHDIGLVRSDLLDAFDASPTTSPTSRLAQIAAQRALEQATRRMR